MKDGPNLVKMVETEYERSKSLAYKFANKSVLNVADLKKAMKSVKLLNSLESQAFAFAKELGFRIKVSGS
jgi:hypothetical protein